MSRPSTMPGPGPRGPTVWWCVVLAVLWVCTVTPQTAAARAGPLSACTTERALLRLQAQRIRRLEREKGLLCGQHEPAATAGLCAGQGVRSTNLGANTATKSLQSLTGPESGISRGQRVAAAVARGSAALGDRYRSRAVALLQSSEEAGPRRGRGGLRALLLGKGALARPEEVARADRGPVVAELQGLRRAFEAAGGPLLSYAARHWAGNDTCSWHGVRCVAPAQRTGGRQLTFARLALNFTEAVPLLPVEIGGLRLVRRLTIAGPCRGFRAGTFDTGKSELRRLAIMGGRRFHLAPLRAQRQLRVVSLLESTFAEADPLRSMPERVIRLRVRGVPIASTRGLDRLKRLTKLFIAGTRIMSLKVDGAVLRRLHTVEVTGNAALADIELVNSPWLARLLASNNSLTGLPAGLAQAERLDTVDLSQNRIAGVVDSTGLPLSTLRYLFMAHNRVTAFTPAPVTAGKGLLCLDVSHNLLGALPPWLEQVPVKSLLFQHNRVPHPPGPWRGLITMPGVVLCEGNAMCDHYAEGRPSIRDDYQNHGLALLSRNTLALAGLVGSLRRQGYISSGTISTIRMELWVQRQFRRAVNPCFQDDVPVAQMVRLGCKNQMVQEVWFGESFGTDVFNSSLAVLPRDLSAFAQFPILDKITVQDDERIAEVPPSLFTLTQVKTMVIKSCGVRVLPRELLEMPSLSVLDLHNNHIRAIEVPRPERAAPLLRKIILDSNEITAIPEGLFRLSRLRVLSAKHNSLASFQYSRDSGTAGAVADGASLDELNLEGNLLTRADLSGFKMITTLAVASNRLTALNVTGLYIRSLLVHHNLLKSLDLSHMRETHLVSAHHNQLRSVAMPGAVAKMDLSYNKLEDVTVTDVNALDVSHNQLARIMFTGKVRLHELNAKNNRLDDAAAEVLWSGNDYGSVVDLSSNLLTRIPEGKLWNQSGEHYELSVDLSGNIISAATERDRAMISEYFTPAFPECKRRLDLSRNKLVGMYDAEAGRALPTLKRGHSLRIDAVAVKGGDRGLNEAVAGIYGEGNTTVAAEAVWKEVESAREGPYQCTVERLQRSDRILVRRCECASSFYASTDQHGALQCRVCLPFAHCAGGTIACFHGFYLDTSRPDRPQCKSCEGMTDGVSCDNNVITPRPGYWRVNNTATTVYACENAMACGGGANATLNCREGHGGAQCSVCLPGYYKTSSLLCEQCPAKSASAIYTLAMSTGVALVVLVLSCMGNRGPRSASKYVAINGGDLLTSAEEGAQEVSQLVKIVVGFAQVLAALPLVYVVDWGEWLDRMGRWFSWVNFDFLSASSLECLLEEGPRVSASALPGRFEFNFYHSMCLQLTIPLLAALVALAAPLLTRMVRLAVSPEHGVQVTTVRSITNRVLVLVMLFAYLPVSTTASQFFKCVSFDGGHTSYMDADLSLQCYNAEWLLYLPVAVVILVVFSAGMPAILVVSLAPAAFYRSLAEKHAASRTFAAWAQSLAEMFMIYRPQYRWWEATELCRKLLVTSVAIHYSRQGQLQILAAMLISFIAVVLHVQCQPFCSSYLNVVQTLHLIMIYLTLSMGVLKNLSVSPDTRQVASGLIVLVDAMLMGMMVLMAAVKAAKLIAALMGRFVKRDDAV